MQSLPLLLAYLLIALFWSLMAGFIAWPALSPRMQRFLIRRILVRLSKRKDFATGAWFSLMPGYQAQLRTESKPRTQAGPPILRHRLFLDVKITEETAPFPFAVDCRRQPPLAGSFSVTTGMTATDAAPKIDILSFWCMWHESTRGLFLDRAFTVKPTDMTITLFDTNHHHWRDLQRLEKKLTTTFDQLKTWLSYREQTSLPTHFPSALNSDLPLDLRRAALDDWFRHDWRPSIPTPLHRPEAKPTAEWYWVALDMGQPLQLEVAGTLLLSEPTRLEVTLRSLLRRQTKTRRHELLHQFFSTGRQIETLRTVAHEFRDPEFNQVLMQAYRNQPSHLSYLQGLWPHQDPELIDFLTDIVRHHPYPAKRLAAEPLGRFGNHAALGMLRKVRPKLKKDVDDPLDTAYFRLKAKIGDLPHVGTLSAVALEENHGALSPTDADAQEGAVSAALGTKG